MKKSVLKVCTSLLTMMVTLTVFGNGYAQNHHIEQEYSWENQTVIIKIAELHHHEVSVTKSGGAVLTGVSDLDNVFAEKQVVSMQRVFTPDPRFAERHRNAGLDRWYIVRYESSAEEAKAVEDIGRLSIIESAQKSYIYENPDEGQGFSTAVNPRTSLMGTDDPLLEDQWYLNNQGQTYLL